MMFAAMRKIYTSADEIIWKNGQKPRPQPLKDKKTGRNFLFPLDKASPLYYNIFSIK